MPVHRTRREKRKSWHWVSRVSPDEFRPVVFVYLFEPLLADGLRVVRADDSDSQDLSKLQTRGTTCSSIIHVSIQQISSTQKSPKKQQHQTEKGKPPKKATHETHFVPITCPAKSERCKTACRLPNGPSGPILER